MSEPIDLALEEKLDELDPLRHLRNDEDLDIVPIQPPSIRNQTIQLTFPSSDAIVPNPIVIKLVVDASPGCGGIAWPAGEVLSSYIARKGSLKGKNVLELGSGTGLVGLVAGILGGTVWITDQAPLFNIMRRNARLNDLADSIRVMELNWGETLPASLPPFDLVLAADCVYFEPAFPLLVQTLDNLTARGTPEILFCYKKRRKADKRFFILLKRRFTWQEVDDDPDRATYERDAISLLRVTRRAKSMP